MTVEIESILINEELAALLDAAEPNGQLRQQDLVELLESTAQKWPADAAAADLLAAAYERAGNLPRALENYERARARLKEAFDDTGSA